MMTLEAFRAHLIQTAAMARAEDLADRDERMTRALLSDLLTDDDQPVAVSVHVSGSIKL